MKVLVCGGRDYADRVTFTREMNRLDRERGPFTLVIAGGQRGADQMAEGWADGTERDKLICRASKAAWRKFGRSAGPRRNARMLDLGSPDLVIAFPGGPGTSDMKRQAHERGVEVIEIPGQP